MTPACLHATLSPLIADHLDGAPLYLAFTSELPPEHRPMADTWGVSGANLDIALRPWLESVDRWEGRGAAIIVNDLSIYADCEQLAEGDHELSGELAHDRLLAIGLHEAAHVVEWPIDVSEPPAGIVERNAVALAAWCKTPAKSSPVPFLGHGATFIRGLCHLIHRHEQFGGRRVVRRLAFDGGAYALSTLQLYFGALRDELDFSSGSFAELRRSTPPRPFVELWRRDLRDFVTQLSATSEIVLAIVDGLFLFSEGPSDG